jgi:hypothetical protein
VTDAAAKKTSKSPKQNNYLAINYKRIENTKIDKQEKTKIENEGLKNISFVCHEM